MWKNVIGKDNIIGEAIHKIFPLAQRDVNNVVKQLREDKAEGYIYVFGSAITSGMNPWSDIDFGNHTSKRIKNPTMDYGHDVIDMFDKDFINDPIYDEILKGVRIDI